MSNTAAAAVALRIRQLPELSRIQLELSQSFPIEFKADQKGFQLLFPRITLRELHLKPSTKISRTLPSGLSGLRWEETPEGAMLRGIWRFRRRLDDPVSAKMEVCAYTLPDQPTWIIDFWPKLGISLRAFRETQRLERLEQLSRQNDMEGRRRRDQRATAEMQIWEAQNPGRFCSDPLHESRDFFLQFYPAHASVDFSRWFKSHDLDENYSYFAHKTPLLDSATRTLLDRSLDYYRSGKLGLASRSLRLVPRERKLGLDRSLDLHFLKANIAFALQEEEVGLAELALIRQMGPFTSLAQIVTEVLTLRLLAQKNYLGALSNFLWLQSHPGNPADVKKLWIYHLGAAECYFSLRQASLAAEQYRKSIDLAPTQADKTEALLRLGDPALLRLDYELALARYATGLEGGADQNVAFFPEFQLNRGEVFYQLGQFEIAQSIFKEFLARNGAHALGWRATFRLGEIASRDRRHFDAARLQEGRRWYLQTINSYPKSPGATLARLRLLPCFDHGGFTDGSQERFFKIEATPFDGDHQVVMSNYEDFWRLAQIKGTLALGTPRRALAIALSSVGRVHSPEFRRMLSILCHQLLRNLIIDNLRDKHTYRALQDYLTLFPKLPQSPSSRELDYLRPLAEATAAMGLPQLAREIWHGLPELRNESHPSFEDAIRDSSARALQALNLWNSFTVSGSNREFKRAPSVTSIKSLETTLEGIKAESPYFYLRELLLALASAVEPGRARQAANHLAQALQSPLSSVQRRRLLAWFGELNVRAGAEETARSVYAKLLDPAIADDPLPVRDGKQLQPAADQAGILPFDLSAQKDGSLETVLGVPETPDLLDLYFSAGKLAEKNARWQEAASYYHRAREVRGENVELQVREAICLLQLMDRISRSEGRQLLLKAVAPAPQTDGARTGPGNQSPASPLRPDNASFWRQIAVVRLDALNVDSKGSSVSSDLGRQ